MPWLADKTMVPSALPCTVGPPEARIAMSESVNQKERRATGRFSARSLIAPVVILVLLAAMALNTKFVSATDDQEANKAFSAAEWAAENYEPVVVPWIEQNAVDAPDLFDAIAADVDAAGEEYGARPSATSAWAFPVQFTGVAGEVQPINGQMAVEIEGMPADAQVFVQMGPAISGSALRDVTGEVEFGMFTNQTEYQTVGLELNNLAKAAVLDGIDAASLAGKTITVEGAFGYASASPNKWLVVPVRLEVE